MRESTCPTCRQRTLRPDPPPNTKEQNIAARRRWDDRFERSQR